MNQRPLRLGDLVDDYCPRERRVTNHAIVAIVEDTIRQTRCTTCEAEHVYRGGRPPLRRARAGEARPQAEGNAGGQLVSQSVEAEYVAPQAIEELSAEALPDTAPAGESEDQAGEEAPAVARLDDADAWPANRTLIRATLPRTEGEPPPPRPIPEFTMHRYAARGGGNGFRQGRGWQGGQGFGNGSRGGRPGQGFGGGQGQGQGQGQGRRRHGKKRHR